MTDNKTGANRVFTPKNVEIGATDRRQRNSDDCFAYSGAWPLNLLHTNIIDAMKDRSSHIVLQQQNCFVAFLRVETPILAKSVSASGITCRNLKRRRAGFTMQFTTAFLLSGSQRCLIGSVLYASHNWTGLMR